MSEFKETSASDGDWPIAAKILQKNIQPAFSGIDRLRETIEHPSEGLQPRPEFDPTEIMVQVLRRPTDPICDMLQECLFAWVDAGIGYLPSTDKFGGWIDVARNWQSFLFTANKKFKYLLMVDSDIAPPVTAPYLLRRHDVPVVSGVACGWQVRQGGLFICIAVPGPDGKSRFVTMKHDKEIPKKGLIEVTNCGSGCLLVRRDVFEGLWSKFERELQYEDMAANAIKAILAAVNSGGEVEIDDAHQEALRAIVKRHDDGYKFDTWGAPFSIPETVRNKAFQIGNMPRGEDVLFTDRVRNDLGMKIYCDLEVQCAHFKTMGLAWPSDARKDISPAEWKSSTFNPVIAHE